MTPACAELGDSADPFTAFLVFSCRYKRQNTSKLEFCEHKIIKIVYAVFKFRSRITYQSKLDVDG